MNSKIRSILRRLLPAQILRLIRLLATHPKIHSTEIGGISFLSPSPILKNVTDDIISGLPKGISSSCPVTIYVGIHRNFGRHWFRKGVRIGLQTEHIFDAEQKPLWGGKSADFDINVGQAISRSNFILDINVNSKKYYRNLPKGTKGKIYFGPHIFPDQQIQQRAGGNDFIFYGNVRGIQRRERILCSLLGKGVKVIPENTFGTDLKEEIADSKGILNIHVMDGVYAEAPRILSAVICGKNIISEPLGHPFVSGVHYLPISHLSSKGRNTDHEQAEVLHNISEMTSRLFSFAKFMKTILPDSIHIKPPNA